MDNNYIAAILFFVPAGIANLVPVLANKVPFWNRWNTPVDFGKSWQGKRITGDNKTWRGIVSGTMVAGLIAVLVAEFVPEVIVNDKVFATGLLLGAGALVGDAVESIAKRRLNIEPGKLWFPWDQIDYIIGGLLFTLPVVQLPLWAVTTIIVAYFFLHLMFAYIGYKLRLKSTPI